MKNILILTALAALLSACASVQGPTGHASSKSPQATLPFGEVEESCAAKGKALGQLIEKNGKWKLYDTRPGAVGPRNFFVTGFKDGCARKVTGAVALFGDLGLYELMHYGGGGGELRGTTDAAYASLRGCGKGPCSESKLKRLSRSTAFVSVYPTPGSRQSLEMLMHNRKLVAAAIK
ncbi:hypothetical protein [Oceanicola sp. 502str15]|uniref:hypothetical protein n=1 Tax=Oceanicola sp. 502str15 TaxID=2696061 RepID=UPI0020963085|nr:hypothetical protein [Oceanicola sp. 502str15]MCO6381174.1 hypothetical protein [Oceanicola sp. 502str15]